MIDLEAMLFLGLGWVFLRKSDFFVRVSRTEASKRELSEAM